MMINGVLCEGCGEWLGDDLEPGHPRYCSEQCARGRGADDSQIVDDDDEDAAEMWREKREQDKARKARNLAAADPAGWTVHTEYHWSRTVAGHRLDFWPSRNKFQYKGRVMCGDVAGFIRNREKETTK